MSMDAWIHADEHVNMCMLYMFIECMCTSISKTAFGIHPTSKTTRLGATFLWISDQPLVSAATD